MARPGWLAMLLRFEDSMATSLGRGEGGDQKNKYTNQEMEAAESKKAI